MPKLRTGLVCLGLLAMVAGLAACGTVRGAGQDIQTTGKAIKRAAS